MNQSHRGKIERILEKLKRGLDQQEQAYREMLRLSKKQNEILQSDDMDKLSNLVQAKNNVMQKIKKAEEQVVPVLQRWQEVKSEFPEEEVEKVEEKFKGVRDLLGQIIDQESKLEEIAKSLKEETSEEISKIMRAMDAQEQYGNFSESDSEDRPD